MSVRGERVVYRERERSSDRGSRWEEAPRRTYTTVKRYQVPESTRSVFTGENKVEEDKQIVIRRERREPSPPRDDIQYRVTERVREREPPREDVDFHFHERIREQEREPLPPQRRDIAYRVIERDSDYNRPTPPRSVVRAPSPPEERVREFRFERERDFSPPRRREQPYDLERYSKSTEYFSQPQPAPQPIIIREAAPQPIIIREERREPLVIREERRDPHYEFIEREEIRDESRSMVKSDHSRSLVQREEPPPPAPVPVPVPVPVQQPEEENYFYERRVREIAPRRRDESYDRRTEVRPRDSASQYSSDDSYEYIRRERTYEGSRSRSHSPHHKRHLAEGAIAGIGAAEILRHHRKSTGGNVGGRWVNDAAGAAVGAAVAEGVSRVRSRRRGGSRSRSRSSSYDSRRDRRDRRGKRRSRSRSKSLSRAQTLGGLAAVAAVGALAGYALNKNKNKNQETVIINEQRPRRSRSRRRRNSADSYYTDDRTVMSDPEKSAQNPEHRNRVMAQAGLASAAAAGVIEKIRSRSRGGRSKSRVRQAVPIVASGLGGAALAGLYEKNKAGKEAKKDAVIQDELGRGRRRRSRSRSRSVPAPYPADDRRVDERDMIAYGHDPVYPEPARGYYSDDEPGMYRRRHRGGSSSGSSPDTRRRGSRSRSRKNIATAGAAAGLAAVGAHEYGKRRERSRQRERDHDEELRRRDEEANHEPYRRDHEPAYPPTPDNAGYLPQEGYPAYQPQSAYPGGNYFPPPPTADYAHNERGPAPEQNPYPAYNPADYAPQGAPQQPYHQSYGQYGESEANLGAPYPNDTFAGDARYAPTPDAAAAHHDERRRGRDSPENVSAPTNDASAERESQDADGMSTPRAQRSRSQSRVRFNLDANQEHSPETPRKKEKEREERHSDTETSDDRKHRRRRRKHGDRARDQDRHRDSPDLMHDKYDREPDSDSEGTVELPQRFDEHGNKKDDDPLAMGINQILGNVGFADILGRLAGGGGGGVGGGHDDDGGRSGRRRHRH